jgi:two-component system KDP operon response regulator KdpE
MTSATSFSILVVDDEPLLRKVIRASLASGGYTVEEVGTGSDAVGLLQRRTFDLVLLDINMPGLNGVEACRKIRSIAPHTGIIMVTVRDAEEDKVRALEAGADDYVTKPFRFRELVARIGAVLRRTRRHSMAEETHLEVGDLRVDFRRRKLWKHAEEIHLSPKEFDLLAFLMKNQGAPQHAGQLEYLRSYVRILRKKIEDDPAQPFYLLTEPWVGYRFHNPADSGLPSPLPLNEPSS